MNPEKAQPALKAIRERVNAILAEEQEVNSEIHFTIDRLRILREKRGRLILERQGYKALFDDLSDGHKAWEELKRLRSEHLRGDLKFPDKPPLMAGTLDAEQIAASVARKQRQTLAVQGLDNLVD